MWVGAMNCTPTWLACEQITFAMVQRSNCIAQLCDCIGNALMFVVDGRACNEQVSSCLHNLWSRCLVDAAIYLDITKQALMCDHLSQASDFRECFRNEILSS